MIYNLIKGIVLVIIDTIFGIYLWHKYDNHIPSIIIFCLALVIFIFVVIVIFKTIKDKASNKNFLCFLGIHHFILAISKNDGSLLIEPTFGGARCEEFCIRCGKKTTRLYNNSSINRAKNLQKYI